MKNNKFETFNDGVVRVYRERPRQTDFNAKRNVATTDDMDFIAKLDFKEVSRREQDVQFAEQNDFTLSGICGGDLQKGLRRAVLI